jgi:hypothetical protein
MKATELRIGNLVNHISFGIVELSGILNDTLKCNYNENEYWDNLEFYKHIPLTEEWLLKFGVKNNRLGLFDFVKVSDNVGYHIYFIGRHLIEIKYVHQLQNLYFALTNEELTLTK